QTACQSLRAVRGRDFFEPPHRAGYNPSESVSFGSPRAIQADRGEITNGRLDARIQLAEHSVVASRGERTTGPAGSLAARRTDMRGTSMRVWLVDDRPGEDPDGLESLLNQLAGQPQAALSLLVVRPGWPEFVTELRARRPDVLLVRDAAWLDGPWTVD